MPLSKYISLVDIQARMALKADAARYFLGYIWWVLEPLLYVGVFYVVFEIILDSGRGDFLIFLMCGKLPFVWFTKTVNLASNSIVANAGLIGKIDIPKSIFPMAIVQEGLYKQLVVFLLLFVLVFSAGYRITPAWLSLIPLMAVQYVMIVACSLIGAVLVCFVRDFSMLISLAMIFLMFTSGIFWDPRALTDPSMTELLFAANPLAFVLDCYRQILMYETSPDMTHLILVGIGFAILAWMAVILMRKLSRWLALQALVT
jgi:lipopolysaccharide transport system permease protein